ncbi:manganese efflux pump MntP family protein [Stakelama sediminis]|uniref:Putative manganese efflux pump MntP n=1 Tax=Stakelama sediminis TaxID=463200 RepID=A0A840Z1H6_9SPHN|nr:manganese efflux pump MntP family protein [Stakelama sediminis]MBB5719838.1 putative Mn2+ efflux pump MntP [Stakelama sediminis]
MTGIATLIAIGFGLSVDAFAAAIGKGASGAHPRLRDALKTGAVFGFFEGITPAIGWAVGLAFSAWVSAFDHWIAFILLLAVGGHMIWNALHGTAEPDLRDESDVPRRGRFGLIATALATSIDATAVGVSLAVMGVNIVVACIVIGLVTTVMATIGVMLGRKAGDHLGEYAEVLGGIALIAIGAIILYEHLNV